MLSISSDTPIYIYTARVDMRKSINGLVNLLIESFDKSRFQYSKTLQDDVVTVNPTQLKALLMGLDFYLLGKYPYESYQEFF